MVMTFHMQLWNTNTQAIVSRDADLTKKSMYISMKFGAGVHEFYWEVGVFSGSCFHSVSCKHFCFTDFLYGSFITNGIACFKNAVLYFEMFYSRYVRAEVLAGFVNGLFLMFIGFFIFSEAVEVGKSSWAIFEFWKATC